MHFHVFFDITIISKRKRTCKIDPADVVRLSLSNEFRVSCRPDKSTSDILPTVWLKLILESFEIFWPSLMFAELVWQEGKLKACSARDTPKGATPDEERDLVELGVLEVIPEVLVDPFSIPEVLQGLRREEEVPAEFWELMLEATAKVMLSEDEICPQ